MSLGSIFGDASGGDANGSGGQGGGGGASRGGNGNPMPSRGGNGGTGGVGGDANGRGGNGGTGILNHGPINVNFGKVDVDDETEISRGGRRASGNARGGTSASAARDRPRARNGKEDGNKADQSQIDCEGQEEGLNDSNDAAMECDSHDKSQSQAKAEEEKEEKEAVLQVKDEKLNINISPEIIEAILRGDFGQSIKNQALMQLQLQMQESGTNNGGKKTEADATDIDM